MSSKHDLDSEARAILSKNDRGGYTVPTARLYPYQWNWDSAFVALGFATFDVARAWRELELLAEGQWASGMIPHILFRQNDPDYFPGPTTWQTPDAEQGGGRMPTGGISQPPVYASIVRELYEQTGNDNKAQVLFDVAYRFNKWFIAERTAQDMNVIATVHPWETGRDNCPDWDGGLAGMDVDPELEHYTRKDTQHADASQRPSSEQYDKYISIVKYGRDTGWNQRTLTDSGPFLVADPGLHFMLLRANRDLLWLANTLGHSDDVRAEITDWIAAGESGAQELWNTDVQAFCAKDLRSGEFSDGFSNASALCFYAGVGTPEQQDATRLHIERIGKKAQFLLPSWDPDHASFEQQRYWKGPLWPQMNYIVAKGLAESGYNVLAERMRTDLAAVIKRSGFRECFDPMTGDGCIGTDFSWTAALWLAWASDSRYSNPKTKRAF